MLRASNDVLRLFGQPPLYASRNPAVVAPVRVTSSRRSLHGGHVERRRFTGRPAGVGSTEDQPDFSSHFHISIGWSLEEPSSQVLEKTRTADRSTIQEIRVKFNDVKMKIGNAVTVVPLSKEVGVGKGLIGS